MSKPVAHVVKRPGRTRGYADIEIPVAEDLVTVPGVTKRDADVVFYSREYPLRSQNIEKAADRDWVWTVYTDEFTKYRTGRENHPRQRPVDPRRRVIERAPRRYA